MYIIIAKLYNYCLSYIRHLASAAARTSAMVYTNYTCSGVGEQFCDGGHGAFDCDLDIDVSTAIEVYNDAFGILLIICRHWIGPL